MVISDRGIALIKRFEGCKLHSYKCPAGVWTIGYGSTAGVGPNMIITQDEAERRLRDDLVKFQKAVTKAVTVPLTQSQFDALVCLTFNIGEGAFKKSTLLRLLNQKRYEAACAQFDKWVNVNGRKNKGLQNRRDAEQDLFRQDDDEASDAPTSSNMDIEPTPPKPMLDSKTVQGGAVVLTGAGGVLGPKLVDLANTHSDKIMDKLLDANSLPLWCGAVSVLGVFYMIFRYWNDRHERAD